MVKNRFYKILSRIVEIKPGEEIISIFLFSYFFLITAPYNIIKSLRNASYLDTLGAKGLPLAYLLTAALIGFVVAFHSKLQVKIPRHLLIISSLIFFILTCFLFWLLFPYGWSWLPLAYWIWANIFIVVLVTQFWVSVNDAFNPREAKRLIGFFGSGGILGGIVGGEVTGFLAKSKVSYDLLLVASGMLIACVFVVNYIFIWQAKRQSITDKADKKDKERGGELPKVGFKDCFDTVRKHYYLKLLAAVVTTTLIVSTLIDFQFNSVVESTLSVRNNLTAFFGHFNAGLMVLPFFLQLLMTSSLIKRYGIRFTLLLYPMVLLLCSSGIAAFPIIYFAILIKGSDKSLSYSLNQSVRELLYIPISPELKYKAKIFIDMFLNRFAKGIGAVILMILLYFHLGIQYVSLASAVFIFVWVILNLKVSKEYINTVKQKLEVKWERADRLVAEKVDVDYTKLVFDTLESKNRSSVLYAMHLFDLIKQDKLTPELKKIISYKSDEIRASSMDSLLELDGEVLIPEIDDALDDESLDVQVKEIMSLDVYQELMKEHINKIVSEESKEAEVSRMEAAKVLGMMEPTSPLIHNLSKLLRDESPEVIRYAVESAGKLKRREFVPLIIQQLSKPSTQEVASKALVEYGVKIIGTLKDYLGDPEEDIRLRKAIPDILARIGTQRVGDLLALELKKEIRDVESEIIEAMYKMKSKNPQIHFQEKIVLSEIILKIKESYLILMEMHDLKADKKKAFSATDLENNLAQPLKHIFELLSLIYPQEDVIKAYQNICTGTKKAIDYSIELLDNMLKKEIKEVLLPLIDDIPFKDKVRKCRKLLKTLEKV
ncbi:MAG: Npt1/Npt2 family nucleotide transporter [Candidatus Aminicenantia bacterium]